MMNNSKVSDKIRSIINSDKSTEERLQEVCEFLNQLNANYTWVGLYIMNHKTRKLHLGPYIGAPTDHVVIPFGRGICGQVAESGNTYIADDVAAEENYIACSIDVRSEIVVPIYDGEYLVAQLDIDSNTKNVFKQEDKEMLENICTLLGEEMGTEMRYENYFSGV